MEQITKTRMIEMTLEEAAELVDFFVDICSDIPYADFGQFLSLNELIEKGEKDINLIGIDSFAMKREGNKLLLGRLDNYRWNFDLKGRARWPEYEIISIYSPNRPAGEIKPASVLAEKDMRKNPLTIVEREKGCAYKIACNEEFIEKVFHLNKEIREKIGWSDTTKDHFYLDKDFVFSRYWQPVVLEHSYNYEEFSLKSPRAGMRIHFEYAGNELFEKLIIENVVKPKNLGNGVIAMAEDRVPKYLQRVLGLNGEK